MKTFEKGARVIVRACVNPKTGGMKVWRQVVPGTIVRLESGLAQEGARATWLVKLDIGPAVLVFSEDVAPMGPLHQLAAEAPDE